MTSQVVSLVIRIRTAEGKQPYCKVVWENEKKKRLKPHYALVNGVPEYHPEGTYHIRFTLDGKQVWKSVGKDAIWAVRQWQVNSCVINNPTSIATAAVLEATTAPAKETLEQMREAFLERKRLTKKRNGESLDRETLAAYGYITLEFLDAVKLKYADQIRDIHLLRWMDALRERGLSHRSVCNYYTSLVTYLAFCGIDHKQILTRDERPEPDDDDPESYTEEEMQKFFLGVDSERDALYFETLLKTGMRELEAAHLEWSDIEVNGDNLKVFIHSKPELDWYTKTRRNRVIPLERSLYMKLMEWKAKRPGTRFIFGTESDRVNWHFLRSCKATAKRAGLDPGAFRLKKFRPTFATWALRRGADLRTVQGWMGHTKIEMTEKYLEKGHGQYAQQKINSVFANFSVAPVDKTPASVNVQ